MKAVRWAYRLQAPSAHRAPRGQLAAWRALHAGYLTEGALAKTGLSNAAALLLDWDQAGWLARELRVGAKAWARLLPQRAPEAAPPFELPTGRLRLAAAAVLHAHADGLIIEAPGSWARVQLVLPASALLLHELSRGSSLARLHAVLPTAPAAVLELLLLLHWCGLLDGTDAARWAGHDLLLHSRTRRGYGSALIGKVSTPAARSRMPAMGPRSALVRGDTLDLPHAFGDVLLSRRSLREHGDQALSLDKLGKFLWFVLAEQPRGQRVWRPYPSGGGVYALHAYLVVANCAGLAQAVYQYDPGAHEIIQLANTEAAPARLLAEAAAAALATAQPHAMLVLCADYARQRAAYGDLGYSLLLKEVGAVMQTAQLVAAGLGLATCPLGTADALAFAQLTGIDPMELPMVGELLLGAV